MVWDKIFLFTCVKTWFFITPLQFIYTFYSIETMSLMYGIFVVPLIILQWCIDPLYRLMLDGGKLEFCPVNTGFAVGCGLCTLSIIYTFWKGLAITKHSKITSQAHQSSAN